jgi:hypothetical protein
MDCAFSTAGLGGKNFLEYPFDRHGTRKVPGGAAAKCWLKDAIPLPVIKGVPQPSLVSPRDSVGRATVLL